VNPLIRVSFVKSVLRFVAIHSNMNTLNALHAVHEAMESLSVLERELEKLPELLELTQATTIEAALIQLHAHFAKEKFFDDLAVRQRRALSDSRSAP
jgi:hypothetical protein